MDPMEFSSNSYWGDEDRIERESSSYGRPYRNHWNDDSSSLRANRRGGGKWIKQEHGYSSSRSNRAERRIKEEVPYYNRRYRETYYQDDEIERTRGYPVSRPRPHHNEYDSYNTYQDDRDYHVANASPNYQNDTRPYRVKQERDFYARGPRTNSYTSWDDNRESYNAAPEDIHESSLQNGKNEYWGSSYNQKSQSRNNERLKKEFSDNHKSIDAEYGGESSVSKNETEVLRLEQALLTEKKNTLQMQNLLDAERKKCDDYLYQIEQEKDNAKYQHDRYKRASHRIYIVEGKIEDLQASLNLKSIELSDLREQLDNAQRKIQQSLNSYTFSQIMDDLKNIACGRPSNLNCTICTDPFISPVTLNCTHSFCKHCIKTWRVPQEDQTCNDKCPNCKELITSQTNNKNLGSLIETWIQGQCATTFIKERLEEIDRRAENEITANNESNASSCLSQGSDIEEIIHVNRPAISRDLFPREFAFNSRNTHAAIERDVSHQLVQLPQRAPVGNLSSSADDDLEVLEVIQARRPAVRRQASGPISERLMMLSGTVNPPQQDIVPTGSEESNAGDMNVRRTFDNNEQPSGTSQTHGEDEDDMDEIIQIIDEVDNDVIAL